MLMTRGRKEKVKAERERVCVKDDFEKSRHTENTRKKENEGTKTMPKMIVHKEMKNIRKKGIKDKVKYSRRGIEE